MAESSFRPLACGILFLAAILVTNPTNAFQDEPPGLVNGSLETLKDNVPEGWQFPARLQDSGYKLTSDSESKVDGERSAMIDATERTDAGFGMLNQSVPPQTYEGKRVKFRAAVRTADRVGDGRAQLWLRADKGQDIVAFDNMDSRPITSDDWEHFEIIADIPEGTTRLVMGMLVLGETKAWLDDASLEIVEGETKTTTMNMPSNRAELQNAPADPFYNHWLLLVAFVLLLFILSQIRDSHLQRFALYFTSIYWLVYSFPQPFINLASGTLDAFSKVGIDTTEAQKSLGQWRMDYGEKFESWATWTANHVFGIEGELVSALRNGSGDTTMAYIQLFIGFVVAYAGATIISGLSFALKTKSSAWLRDTLRTYLRWVLALTMLSYGLAKAGFISTQFGGIPSDFRLDRTYGSSSPMGLLWTFIAVSPMYTFFAGLGEVVGGVLLVFRRTATLGAMVTFGVMLNVVMLNFCYDVPVKQYSFHLTVMAILVAFPDFPRLANVLFFNRPTESSQLLLPPYVGPRSIWGYRALKAFAVILLVIVPVSMHSYKEVTHEHVERAQSKHFLLKRGFHWVNEFPLNR